MPMLMTVRVRRSPRGAGNPSRRQGRQQATHAVTQVERMQPLANLRWCWYMKAAQPQRLPASSPSSPDDCHCPDLRYRHQLAQ